jgi:hypothetical protein
MIKKPIIILVGFLLMIFLFGKYTTWQIEKWQNSLPRGVPKIEIEELGRLPRVSLPETFPFPTGTYPQPFPYPEITPPEVSRPKEYKEFISPDRKLKMKIPPNWLSLEAEGFRKALPERLVKNYNLELLFLALKFGGESSGQLVIGQMIAKPQIEIEEIFEEIKENVKEKGWEIELIKSEIGEKEILFEAIYKKEGSPILYSKDKLISLELEDKKKVFWIEILSTTQEWEYLKKEVEETFNSIQLIE